MARRITKASGQSFDFGNGGLGDRFGSTGIVSCSFYITPQSFSTSTAGDNVIFIMMVGGTTHGMKVNFNATSGNLLRVGARSTGGDAFQSQVTTATFVAGTRYHIGAVFDFAGDLLKCTVDGVSDFSTAVTFGSAVYDNGTPTAPDQIAINTGTQYQVDGELSELTFWHGETTTIDFAAISNGQSALTIRPENLAAYIDFKEESGNVVDYLQGTVGTQVGTVAKADHPPVHYYDCKPLPFAATAGPPVASVSVFPATMVDGVAGYTLTVANFGGNLTSVKLISNQDATRQVAITYSGSGTAYTVDSPVFHGITVDTNGIPYSTATDTFFLRVTDGTDTVDTSVVAFNPAATHSSVKTATVPRTDVGSFYENFTGFYEDITAMSVANPSVLTIAAHDFLDGQDITVSLVSTTPDTNGEHVWTEITVGSGSIPVNVTAVADGVGKALSGIADEHGQVTWPIANSTSIDADGTLFTSNTVNFLCNYFDYAYNQVKPVLVVVTVSASGGISAYALPINSAFKPILSPIMVDIYKGRH